MKRNLLPIVCLVVLSLAASAASAAVIGSHTADPGSTHAVGELSPWIANLWASPDMTWPPSALFNGPVV